MTNGPDWNAPSDAQGYQQQQPAYQQQQQQPAYQQQQQPAYQQQQQPAYQQQQPVYQQQPSYQQQAYQQPPIGQPNPYAAMVPAGYATPGVAPVQAPAGMYFDQLSGLMLPQGTQLATVGRRIGSYFLAIPLAFVTLGIGYIIWGAISWAHGQTPTQQVLGMRTWKPQTGANATWGTMFLRDGIGRIVTGIIPFIGPIVSFYLFVTGKERKALHDHIGGTIVLSDPNKVLAPVSANQIPAA